MNRSLFRTEKECWTAMDWKKVEQIVRLVQHRITTAAEQKQHHKVRRLQNQLVNSLVARLIAVRKVAQENAGKPHLALTGRSGQFQSVNDRRPERYVAGLKQGL